MKKIYLTKIIREETKSVLSELSVREIKSRIRQILDLDEVQKYKVDNFNYENIPFSIFELNGITPTDLKQYKQSSDIVTFDLGISINPIKKDVDVFLQKQGIFNEETEMNSREQKLREYIRKYIKEAINEVAPPGWEGTVKAMKKNKDIDNPWALAWSMKNKGAKPHKKESIEEAKTYSDYFSYVSRKGLTQDEAVKLLYTWVKTGVIKYRDFKEIISNYDRINSRFNTVPLVK